MGNMWTCRKHCVHVWTEIVLFEIHICCLTDLMTSLPIWGVWAWTRSRRMVWFTIEFFLFFCKTIPRLYLSGKFSFVVTITAYTSIDMFLIAR
jgi:hypothetical protein